MGHAYTSDHQWVGATTVSLTSSHAAQADRRGTLRIPRETKVEVLEVYCDQCKRPYDAVNGQACVASENRDHLIGGPTGERKKRKGHASGDYEPVAGTG